ncbi:hypothetical protein [Kitasatospora phosalacinea]|uniref:Uncharacterized protein n=1 Tax=Kitasatospora phosalacinea TaxID=2065 RepID=A0A9W6UMB6_9ACTN|nr:hypothetical protein [Kitasatospora phosalacinea]GLW53038.1 hypothetical protein Kpho01_10490 [Kitasatospora phosalacinea]
MRFVELLWSEETAVKAVWLVVATLSEWLLQVLKGRSDRAALPTGVRAEIPAAKRSEVSAKSLRSNRRSARRVGELKRVKARRAPSRRPAPAGNGGASGRRPARRRTRPGTRTS